MSITNFISSLVKSKIIIQVIDDQLKINAPKGMLTPALVNELKEKKEEVIEFLKNARKQDKYSAIPLVEKKEYYALSSAQKRMFVLNTMILESTTYNIFRVITLGKEVEKKRLENLFKNIISRHESLRTYFLIVGEEPVQRIQETVEFEIDYFEAGSKKIEEIKKNYIKAFDLSQAPLLRVGLIKTPDKKHFLIFDMHHIITDGTSQDVLEKEFMALDLGKELPASRLQYKDFSKWQNSSQQRELIEQQESYWVNLFSDEFPVLNLPTDFPRPLMKRFEGASLDFGLNEKDTCIIKKIAGESEATLYMTVLALLNILLAKLSGQEDIIVGMPTAGRRHPDLEHIIGMFVNILAIRNYPTADKTFKEFLQEVKQRTLDAYENQEYQFEALVDKLLVRRDTSRNPILDVTLNLETHTGDIGSIPAIKKKYSREHIESSSKFDLSLIALDYGQRLLFSLRYCTKLFKTNTIKKFIKYFKKLISQLPRNINSKISDIEIITGEEKQKLLYEFNDSAEDYPTGKVIHEIFEVQAARSPHHIALVFEDQQLTYCQLNKYCNRLAEQLRNKGIQIETIVGIMVERSIEMVVGILGILKAGGAYLPVSCDFPRDRIEYMFGNANVKVVLTQERFIGNWQDETGYRLINLNTPLSDKEPGHNLEKINHPCDLAYVIYTSGSTGRPKGVMIENRSVINILKCFARRYSLEKGVHLLHMSEYTFDASVDQILGSLLHGVTLHIIRKEKLLDIDFLRDYIVTRSIYLINFVPSMIKELLCGRQRLKNLRYIISGAENLKKVVKDEILDNGYCLHNHYGPTEATVWVLAEECSHEHDGTVGTPAANARCYIVNKCGQLNPVGTAGELWLAGDGLAKGYINEVELTAEKFIPNPFCSGNHGGRGANKRIYKTGDLTRWLPDGTVEFLGRIDHQVKIRGFRIEPGEIENRLEKIDEVKQAVVVYREGVEGDMHLCAYIITSPEGEGLDKDKLKTELSRSLPDCMIPSRFIVLDEIPLTRHGKLDRDALPLVEVTPESNDSGLSTVIERKLAEIWSNILHIDKNLIGIHANFFELGGHSLKAITLTSRLHKELDLKIHLADIFNSPTIRKLAEFIKEAKKDRYFSIKPVEKKEYHPLSSAQKRLYLLQQMFLNSTSYNMTTALTLKTDIDKRKLEITFKKLISRHKSLRTSFEMVKHQPVQRIHDHVGFEIQCRELSAVKSHHSLANNEENLSGGQTVIDIIEKFVRPFDLSKAPLLRVRLIKVKTMDKKNILLYDLHHIITDGISQDILAKEFMTLYAEQELSPLRLQYNDFSNWQNSRQQQELIKQQETYWLKLFSGELPVLNLPTDYPRTFIQTFQGNSVSFLLSKKDTKNLKTLAVQENATLFMFIMAVFAILLSKQGGEDDIIIGTPTAGRSHMDVENIVGNFINILPIRTYPSAGKTFREFLKEVRTQAANAFRNQDYPFDDLVDRIVVSRDITRNPIFNVVFNLLDQSEYSTHLPDSGEAGLSEIKKNKNLTSKFDISLIVINLNHNLLFSFEYYTTLFKEDTMHFYFKNMEKIIKQVTRDKEKKIKDIELMDEEDEIGKIFSEIHRDIKGIEGINIEFDI